MPTLDRIAAALGAEVTDTVELATWVAPERQRTGVKTDARSSRRRRAFWDTAPDRLGVRRSIRALLAQLSTRWGSCSGRFLSRERRYEVLLGPDDVD